MDVETINKDYDTKLIFPEVSAESCEISEDTLRMIDVSMAELKKGKASEAIDLSEFED